MPGHEDVIQATATFGRFGRLRQLMAGGLGQRLRNMGHLLTGNAASAVLALVAVALTARALGPVEYGLLALAFTYCRAIEKVFTFQSWQPLIRYGAALDGPENSQAMRSLMKYGLALDLAGAITAAGVAAALVSTASHLFGWSERTRDLVLIFCLAMPFNLNGMATAALRLEGRFRIAAWGSVISNALKLAAAAVALGLGAGLHVFAMVWAASQALGAMIVLAMALQTLQRRGVTRLLSAPLSGVTRQFEGLWRFSWVSNLSLTLRSSANELDVLIVGALAGPSAAGFYHLAKRSGRLAEQVSTQAQAVLFPDVARLWASRRADAMWKAVKEMELILIGFGLLCTVALVFVAEPLLRWTAGPQFIESAPLMIAQMIAVTLMMAGSGARSALLSMGMERTVLKAVLIGTACFHAAAFTLVPLVGAMGANVAHILMGGVIATIMLVAFRREMMKLR